MGPTGRKWGASQLRSDQPEPPAEKVTNFSLRHVLETAPPGHSPHQQSGLQAAGWVSAQHTYGKI